MALSGDAIVKEVQKFVGSPYVWGGTSPKGFDCSGLVVYVLGQLGVHNVPRTSEEQWAWVKRVSSPAPGDLVFANFPGEVSPGHVGIYVGGGRVLSAEDPALGVGYAKLSDWGNAIVGYGRVPSASPGSGSTDTSGSTGTSTTTSTTGADATPVSADSLGVGGLLKGAEGLLHGTATVLDYFFGMFGRGQGWRFIFVLVAGVALWASYRNLAAGGTGGWA